MGRKKQPKFQPGDCVVLREDYQDSDLRNPFLAGKEYVIWKTFYREDKLPTALVLGDQQETMRIPVPLLKRVVPDREFIGSFLVLMIRLSHHGKAGSFYIKQQFPNEDRQRLLKAVIDGPGRFELVHGYTNQPVGLKESLTASTFRCSFPVD